MVAKVDELEWAEQFTNNYKEKFPKDEADDLYNMNMASIRFYERKYEEAMAYVHRSKEEDLFYHLNSQMLIIKSLYCLNTIEDVLKGWIRLLL